MFSFKKSAVFAILIFLLFITTQISFAQQQGEEKSKTPPGSSEPVKLVNPLGGTKDKPEGNTNIPSLLGTVINSVLGVVGSLALVMFIYGGITWMLSGGNPERVTKGKQILIWATLGIIIIFTAYALVRFVLTTVTGT